MKRLRVCVLAALAAVLAGAPPLLAQGTVRGRVIDADQLRPLVDATVTVADRSTLSGTDGFFIIENVPAGQHVVTVNLIGYRKAEIPVTVLAGGEHAVDARLQVAPFELAPVVAIGYGQQETKDLTGVITKVAEESFNTGRIVSAEELISAKVAGVQVTESNGSEPGGGISIRIRGGTSVTSSNEPLFVIDGVPIDVGGGLSAGRNPLNFLNPNDITSFTVLKDASATAIYGSRGANGVILIETSGVRGAAAGGPKITYTGSVSGSSVTKSVDVLNAQQFRDVVASEAPEVLPRRGAASTDWRDEVERSAFGTDHTIAVAGGSDKLDYRISLGFLNQEGVVEAAETERISFNFAYSHLLFEDRLRLQANLLGTRTEDDFTPGGVLNQATQFAPTQPILDPDSPFGGFFEWDDALGVNNPVADLNLIVDEGISYRSVGNVTGEYALPFLDGLTATSRLGYVLTNSERRTFAPSISRGQAETGLDGTVSRSNPTETSWLVDAFLTYSRTLLQHSFDLTGGYSFQRWQTDSPSFFAQGLASDLLGINGIPTAELERTFLTIDESRLASYFWRANYAFRDRYLLSGSIRIDGSSKFGPDNQWGTFPSLAAAWRLSDEPFLRDSELFSDLKLRLSWGRNGNQAFPSFQQFKQFVFGDPLSRVQFGDEFVSTVRPSAADPNIKWESTDSWNLGVDFGLWDNRVWGSLELYSKNTEDLIFNVPVAAGTNLSNFVTTNVGEMDNKGIELTLNAALARGDDRGGLQWDANFNFAFNDNELLEINPFGGGSEKILVGGIAGGVGSTIQVLQPGESVNSFFVFKHKRDASGNPIYEDANSDGTINDQDLYEDLNGDGTINQDDRRASESPAPDFILGHSSFLRWKKVDLSFTLLAQFGNHVYNNVASATGFFDQLRDSSAPNNMHESVLEFGFDTPQFFSDVYVEDASFLRMQNIELGYTFGPALRGMRLYGVVQNVFTITGYDGIDPTAGINGIDNNIFPRSRTFTAGVRVQL